MHRNTPNKPLAKDSDKEWQLAKEHAGEAKDEAVEAGKHAAAATGDSLSNVKDAAGGKIAQTGSALANVRDAASERLAGATSQAQQLTADAGQKVEGLWKKGEREAEEAKKSSREAVDNAQREMGDKATAHWASPRDLQQAAEDAGEQIKEDSKGLLDRVKGYLHIGGTPTTTSTTQEPDTIECARDSTKTAVDVTADKAHDVAHTTRTYAKKAKEEVNYTVKQAEDAAHQVADKTTELAQTAADKVQETRRWMAEQAEAAKDAWVGSITAHNEEEELLSEGLIPSNTEDVLKGKSEI